MKRWAAIFWAIAISNISFAQFVFEFEDEVQVLNNATPLALPWAGGINSAQFNTIDFDGDGDEDLVILDRASDRITTYLNENNGYLFAPDFAIVFPEDVDGWLVLKDYNCDGRKDLFTSNPQLGMKVYQNIGFIDGLLSWNLVADPIFTQGFSSQINLQVNGSDIPGIEDLDGDGDLDILVYNFAIGGGIEYHKNLSVENNGNCGELQYERITKTYGGFEECLCDLFAFQETCNDVINGGGRVVHAGGKSILSLDMDADGDKDILVGQEQCQKLNFLENVGTAADALMTGFTTDFPFNTQMVNFKVFPAAYYEDVDFDGTKDLLVSPNASFNINDEIDFANSSWFYHNAGSDNNPNFEFVENTFLQGDMIDMGDQAAPAFGDIDGDGDQDMILGGRGLERPGGFYATLQLYENIGSSGDPLLSLIDEDFLGLSSRRYKVIKPQIVDFDRNGGADILLTTQLENSVETVLSLIPNSNDAGQTPSYDQANLQTVNIDLDFSDNPFAYDISGDGALDLVIGKFSGAIEYHRNDGGNNFTLEDDSFYDISNNPFRIRPSLAIHDLDASGQPELITVDVSGEITIYSDFILTLDSPQPGENEIVFNETFGGAFSYNFGRDNWISIANLHGADRASIALGTSQGGVQILNNADGVITNPGVNPIEITIFPNPGSSVINNGRVNIRVNQEAQVEVVSILGQTVMEGMRLKRNETLQIDSRTLPSGLYLVKAFIGENFTTSRLLITN